MKIIKTMPAQRIEFYSDNKEKWRWRLISTGNIMADSGQGYASKQGCLDAITRVKELMKTVKEFEVKK